MENRSLLKRLLGTAIALAVSIPLVGCGTLLYPERHGRRGGRIDPAILVLDGVLLFCFVIPGVVAYAIDFYTGAIYVPTYRGRASVIHLSPGEMTAENIERAIAEQTGVEVDLDDPRVRRLRLEPGTDIADVLERVQQASFDPSVLPASS